MSMTIQEHAERAERFFGKGKVKLTPAAYADALSSWAGLVEDAHGFPQYTNATVAELERIHHGAFFAGAVRALAAQEGFKQEVANVRSH